MFKNKKVLVTGGTGMIGRQLVQLLIEREANVYVVSLDQPVGMPEGVKFANIDLIGIPTQIILGEKSLKYYTLEIKNRKTKEIIKVKIKNMNEILKNI